MRHRCTSHGSGPTDPVLAGPGDAAAVVRASAPPSHGPAVVALLCDRDHRLLLTITVEGATPSVAANVADLVLAVAGTAGVAEIVIGIVQPRLGQYLPKPDVAALHGLAPRCAAAGVVLLDLLLVGPRGWRSVRHLAEGDP